MRRRILIACCVLLATAGVGLVLFVSSGPALPADANAVIDEVLSAELPELVTGVTGRARSEDIDIWYESIGNRGNARATVLLIMGAGGSALLWPDYFSQPLIDAGYHVVRYDNRGLGMSDWMDEWDAAHPHTLENMARDGIAVLDALSVTRAHIVGISMGGMIGQRMAISHTDRVLSLTSISSSGYFDDPELPSAPTQFARDVLKLGLRYGLVPTERNQIRFVLGLEQLLQGDGENEPDVRSSAQATLYELRERNGFNPGATEQQAAAILASGSRYDELGGISVPTLVVHGRSDPLVLPAHADRYAPMIPRARMLWVEGMGHLFRRAHAPQILDAIHQLFSVAEVQASN